MATLGDKFERFEVPDGARNEALHEILEKLGTRFQCREGECGRCVMEVTDGLENLRAPREPGEGPEWRRMCRAHILQGDVTIAMPPIDESLFLDDPEDSAK